MTEESWFNSQQGQESLLFSSMSRMALVLTQPPIHFVPGVLFTYVKQPANDWEHLPLFSVKLRMHGGIPPSIHLHGMHSDIFISFFFYLYFCPVITECQHDVLSSLPATTLFSHQCDELAVTPCQATFSLVSRKTITCKILCLATLARMNRQGILIAN